MKQFRKPKKFKSPTDIKRDKERGQRILGLLSEAANEIHQRTRNGSGNYFMVGGNFFTHYNEAMNEHFNNIPTDDDVNLIGISSRQYGHEQPDQPPRYITIDNGDNGIRIPINDLPSQGEYYGDLFTPDNEE